MDHSYEEFRIASHRRLANLTLAALEGNDFTKTTEFREVVDSGHKVFSVMLDYFVGYDVEKPRNSILLDEVIPSCLREICGDGFPRTRFIGGVGAYRFLLGSTGEIKPSEYRSFEEVWNLNNPSKDKKD